MGVIKNYRLRRLERDKADMVQTAQKMEAMVRKNGGSPQFEDPKQRKEFNKLAKQARKKRDRYIKYKEKYEKDTEVSRENIDSMYDKALSPRDAHIAELRNPAGMGHSMDKYLQEAEIYAPPKYEDEFGTRPEYIQTIPEAMKRRDKAIKAVSDNWTAPPDWDAIMGIDVPWGATIAPGEEIQIPLRPSDPRAPRVPVLGMQDKMLRDLDKSDLRDSQDWEFDNAVMEIPGGIDSLKFGKAFNLAHSIYGDEGDFAWRGKQYGTRYGKPKPKTVVLRYLAGEFPQGLRLR